MDDSEEFFSGSYECEDCGEELVAVLSQRPGKPGEPSQTKYVCRNPECCLFDD